MANKDKLDVVSSSEARLLLGGSSTRVLSVYPYEITYYVRDYLKKILDATVFEKYKYTSMFDFVLESLGKKSAGFDCTQEERAVAMFVSSYIKPFSNDGVYVYRMETTNSLLLVSKNEQFGMMQFIYPKNMDTLVFVSIEGSPQDMSDLLLEVINKRRE